MARETTAEQIVKIRGDMRLIRKSIGNINNNLSELTLSMKDLNHRTNDMNEKILKLEWNREELTKDYNKYKPIIVENTKFREKTSTTLKTLYLVLVALGLASVPDIINTIQNIAKWTK